jgi:putative ABC transport system permease protein
LRYEWRRFLPGLLSVAFAGVLMLVQLGLLLGMFGTVTVLVDEAAADLWVTSPETASFDQARDIPETVASLARSSAEIERTESLRVHDADWRSGEKIRVSVTLVGLEPSGDALACPASMRDGLCALLAEPMAVIVDQGESDKLGTSLGQLAELNGKRVRVVAVTRGLRSIGSPYVFASRQTAGILAEAGTEGPTFVLARLRPGTSAADAREHLQELLQRSAYRVWTAADLSIESQRYWLLESGVGAGFLFSSLLGLTIGVVITSQTLRSVILGSVREYATFRAIGVPPIRLGGVVLEQSLWIGVLGAALTLVVSVLAAVLARVFFVPLTLTWWSVALAIVIGLVTAALSGLLALRELYRLEPAELLR